MRHDPPCLDIREGLRVEACFLNFIFGENTWIKLGCGHSPLSSPEIYHARCPAKNENGRTRGSGRLP